MDLRTAMVHRVNFFHSNVPISYEKDGKRFCPFCKKELKYHPVTDGVASNSYNCDCADWKAYEKCLIDFDKKQEALEQEFDENCKKFRVIAMKNILPALRENLEEIEKLEMERDIKNFEDDMDRVLKNVSEGDDLSNYLGGYN